MKSDHMRIIFTLAIILSIVTSGYSDPKKPKPKKCTVYSCSDWDWQNGKGLFDPLTIQWPLHHTGDIYKDHADGGSHHIEVAFTHGYYKYRLPLKEYRNSKYHRDPWFLDEGIKMKDPFICEGYPDHEPSWKSNSCAQIFSSFEDKHLYTEGTSCGKIVREWTIVDWCKWEPNTIANTKEDKYVLVYDRDLRKNYFAYGRSPYDLEHDGWYTFKQVIKILDEDPPQLGDCSDVVLELEDACTTKIKLKNKAIDTGDCPSERIAVELEVVNEDDPHRIIYSKWLSVKSGEDFWIDLGYLNAGVYDLRWNLSDGCNNGIACIQKLRVIDKNPPHLICIQDLSTAISDEYGASIWAEDFVHKVTGPCYDDNLTFSFYPDTVVSSLTFNCPDGIGLNEMEVYVTGTNGVTTSCNVSIFVADHAECDPTSMQIAGRVTDRYNNPLMGAEIMVTSEEQYVGSDMSNESGIYGIKGITFDLGRPVIAASLVSDEDPAKGLDSRDMVLVLREVMGIQDLPTAEAKAAADINDDGEIDLDDYWGIASVIYDLPGYNLEYSAWKFYDGIVQHRFDGFHHSRLVAPIKIQRFKHQYSLVGIKTGDVDFSWRPGVTSSGRSAGVTSSYDQEGRHYSINVPEEKGILTLRLLGQLDERQIQAVTIDNHTITYKVIPGDTEDELIILSEHDLSGKRIDITLTDSSARLNDRGSIYVGEGVDGLQVREWFLEKSLEDQEISFRLSPNPFEYDFALSAQVATDQDVAVSIYSISGQLVESQDITLYEGHNEVKLSGASLRSGVYLIEMQSGGKTIVQKIVKQ